MYHDLKVIFWWLRMKGDIASYVFKCLTCQKVKIEHQKPFGTLQPSEIPQWKWKSITMDFVSGLPRTRTGFDTSRQKSYADQRWKPLEFDEGDYVILRVIPITGVGRVIKAKKLNLHDVFQILKRIRPVAYRIALPPRLSNLHDMFPLSQLRKYTSDTSHILELESVQLKEDLTLQVTPVRIDDTSVKRLRGKEVSLVKVAWSRAGIEEHT
ncbi:uncharacterized protein [Arachis hypogaea]|uniref:uncharacterized protein n=1 Tax=Arachis hypogaea TaxID=3818 RepID=UPI003B2289BB